MKTIPLTKGYSATVCDCHYDSAKDLKWCASTAPSGTYAVTGIWSKEKKNNTMMRMHRLIVGAKPGEIVDHIDGDRMNNQCSNLRLATKSTNAMNTKNKSKGVYFFSRDNNWVSKIGYMGKQVHIGYFPTREEAEKARLTKERELFGEFAR